MLGHSWCSWTPLSCSMMMYSLPMPFEASSLEARILGIGMLVCFCTKFQESVAGMHFSELLHNEPTMSYSGDFRICSQSIGACVSERQSCHDTLRVVGGENENTIEAAFKFLVVRYRCSARRQFNYFSTQSFKIELEEACVAL
jgi:hypothetical protein